MVSLEYKLEQKTKTMLTAEYEKLCHPSIRRRPLSSSPRKNRNQGDIHACPLGSINMSCAVRFCPYVHWAFPQFIPTEMRPHPQKFGARTMTAAAWTLDDAPSRSQNNMEAFCAFSS